MHFLLQLSLALFIIWLLKRLSKILDKIDRLLKPIGKAYSIEFYALIDGQFKKVKKHMFLKASQKLPVTVAFKDKFGNLAQVDGKPEWSVTDTALATLEVAEDGMSATVLPLGPLGTFSLQVSADADLGEGLKSILGSLLIELLPAEAITVELSPGTPEDQA